MINKLKKSLALFLVFAMLYSMVGVDAYIAYAVETKPVETVETQLEKIKDVTDDFKETSDLKPDREVENQEPEEETENGSNLEEDSNLEEKIEEVVEDQEVPEYRIDFNLSTIDGGQVIVDAETIDTSTYSIKIEENDDFNFKTIPYEGYKIRSVQVDGIDLESNSENHYVLTMIEKNTTIQINFEKLPVAEKKNMELETSENMELMSTASQPLARSNDATLAINIGDQKSVPDYDTNYSRTRWISSDETIASVTGGHDSGWITGISEGTTTVKLQRKKHWYSNWHNIEKSTYSVTVSKIEEVSRVTVEAELDSVTIGETTQVTAIVMPEEATDRSITWSSSDETIAMIDQTGKVSTLKEGKVRIIATSKNNVSGNVEIEVMPVVVSSVTVISDYSELVIGSTAQATAIITPVETSDKSVTWTSSDEKIAQVSSDGRITGITEGSVDIIATSNSDPNVSNKIKITIKKDTSAIVNSISINYYYEDGVRAVESLNTPYTEQEIYRIDIPQLDGFTAHLGMPDAEGGFIVGEEIVTLSGKLTEDKEETVIYVGNEKKYTVNHYQENNYGEMALIKTQELIGKVGEETAAKVEQNLLIGFTASPPNNQILSATETVVIDINYTCNRYAVVFDTQGGSYVNRIDAKYGAQINIDCVDEPSKNGYQFQGWYDNKEGTGNQITGTFTLCENKTFYAKWETEDINYTVIHWLENTTSSGYDFTASQVKTGKTDEIISLSGINNEYDYFTYDKQKTALENLNISIDGNGTTIINVYYTRNSYTVFFDFNKSGCPPNACLAMNGIDYTLYDENYSFTAKYESDISRLWPTASDFEIGSHKFQGWSQDYYLNGILNVSKRRTLTKDLINTNGTKTMYAKWTNNLAKVDLHYMFESLDGTGLLHKAKYYKQDQAYSQIAYSSTLNWFGKAITGYTNSDNKISDKRGNDGDYDIYFYYDRDIQKLEFYNYNGIDTDQTQLEIKFGSLIDQYKYMPLRPKGLSNYYKFGGWYTTENCLVGTEVGWNNTVMPYATSGGIIYYAKWEAPEYQVDFNVNGGSGVLSQRIIAGEKASHPHDPTKEGYQFTGWYKNKNCTERYDFNQPVTKEKTTIYSGWKAVTETNYVIYFIGSDGNIFDAQGPYTGEVGNVITKNAILHGNEIPDAATKTVKLSSDSSKNVITFNYTLPIERDYTVHYYYEGTTEKLIADTTGSTSATKVYVNFKSIPGYVANAYREKIIMHSSGINEIAFYYAPISYNITYDLDKGFLESGDENLTTYTKRDTISLNNPIKNGYTFIGWTGTDVSEYAMSIRIPKGSMGDKNYKAHYEANTDIEYIVKYQDNNGKTLVADKVVKDQTMGSTVKEDAKVVLGYTVKAATKNLTLKATGNEIVFVYEANANITYTVKYQDNNGKTLVADKMVKDQMMGSTVKEDAKVVLGYTAKAATKNLTLAATGNEIVFVYKANTDTAYVVEVYEQQADGTYPGIATRQSDRAGTTGVNTSVTTADKTAAMGYALDLSAGNIFENTLAGDGSTVLKVYFKSQYNVAFEPGTQGSFTATQTGNLDYGSDTPAAPDAANTHAPGYTFTGWSPILATRVTENETYTATYKAKTNINYTVKYQDNNGKTLVADKVVKDQTMGSTVKEDAKVVLGYTVKAATKNLTLKATGNEIVFVYEANADTAYVVEVYEQQADGTYPGIATRQSDRAGTTGVNTSVTTADKTATMGYALDLSAGNIFENTLAGDGSTVLKVYFKSQYNVAFEPGTQGSFTATQTGNLDYGSDTPAAPDAANTHAPGYTFTGWNPVLATRVTENETYSATYKANTDTAYVVEVYEQQADGTYPGIATRQSDRAGTTGVNTSVTTADKTAAMGYALDLSAENIFENTLAGDGSTVLKVYFKSQYNVAFEPGTQGSFTATQTGNLDYGSDTPAAPDAANTHAPGYTFTGWSPILATRVTENETYTATYKAKTNINYTVKYQDNNGKTLVADKVVKDQTMGSTVKEDAKVVLGYTVKAATKNLTLKATGNEIVFVYEANADTAYVVEVYEQQADGTYPGIATRQSDRAGTTGVNTSVTTADKTAAMGYALDLSAGNIFENTLAGDGSTVLKVYFKSQYNVAFEPGTQGSFTATQTGNLDYGSDTPAAPDAANTHAPGYTFTGWSPILATRVTENETYTATYKAKTNINYTVKYQDNNGKTLVADKMVKDQMMGSTVKEDAKVVLGYTAKAATKNLTLAATGNEIVFVYKANTDTAYVVEVYEQQADGTYPGIATRQSDRAGTTGVNTSVTTADKTAAMGYALDLSAGNIFENTLAGDGSTVLKVYFKSQYNVAFEPGTQGSFTATQTGNLDYGSDTPAAPDAANTHAPGYTFTGWNPVLATRVTENETYSATYKANTDTAYVVEVYEQQADGTYPGIATRQSDRAGTTGVNTSVTTADKTAAMGYALDLSAGNIFENTLAGDGSTVLKVYFKSQYNVVFEPGTQGSFTATQTGNLDYGSDTPAAPDAANTYAPGYTFTGWSPILATTVTENETYTAQWEINQYTITIIDPDGNVIGSELVEYGSNVNLPIPPTRTGEIFVGWKGTITNITSNGTVVAEYTVTPVVPVTPVNIDSIGTLTTIQEEQVPLADTQLDNELKTIEDEKTPLNNTKLTEHKCCILHFLILLLALMITSIYIISMKRRQARIFEIRKKIAKKESKNY